MYRLGSATKLYSCLVFQSLTGTYVFDLRATITPKMLYGLCLTMTIL